MKSLATPVRPWVSIAIMPARADLATRTSCARIPSSNSPIDSMRPLPFATASHSDSFDIDALSTKHPRISPREYSTLLSISVTFIPVQHRDKSHSVATTGSGSVRSESAGYRADREKDADGSPHGPAREDELDDTEPILQSRSSSCHRRCDRLLRRFSGVGLAAGYVSVQRCRG